MLLFYGRTIQNFLGMIGGVQLGKNPLLSTIFEPAILRKVCSCFSVSAMVRNVCCGIWKRNQGSQLIARLEMTSHLKIQKPDSNPRRNWCSFELHSCYFILNFKHFLLNMENLLFSPNLILSVLLFLVPVLKCS